MNSKQKICAIAAGVMAVSSVMPAGVLGADYSKELQEAYKWAYENGVTTMNTIDQANMYGNLTRIAMAKMLANYAINNLGKKPDTSIDCAFPDVTTAMDKAYDNGVTNACQLGIMGQGITNFDPNGTVTRAQFGTALSRLLWGDKNNASDEEQRAGVQYYKYHLNALNKSYNGTTIMKDISNPSQNEVRGYVMLMLQRSAGMVGKSTEECTATQQLLCLLEGNCTSACEEAMKDINNGSEEETSDDNEETEVKHGNLSVSVEGQGTTKDIPTKGTVVMDSLTFKASEETTLRSVTFETKGLTDTNAIDEIRFEKDGVKVGYEKSFDSKGIAKVSLWAKGFTIKKNETLDLIVKVKSENAGSKIAFEVTDVDSTATVKISNSETVVCTLVTYGVAQTEFVGNNDKKTLKLGEEEVITLGSFTVKNVKADTNDDRRSITLKSITLTNNGKAELEDLSNIIIEKDGVKISSNVTIEKDKLTIVMNDEIESSVKNEYIVKASINNISHNGDDYELSLEEDTDLIIDETKSGFRSPITSTERIIGKVTVNGGTIQIDGTAKAKDASQGWKVLIAEGTLKTSTPVTFKNANTGDFNWYSFGVQVTEGTNLISKDDAYLEVNGTHYEMRKDGNILWVKGNIDFTKTENTIKVYVTLSDNSDDYGQCKTGSMVVSTGRQNCTGDVGIWSENVFKTVAFGDIKGTNFSDNGTFDSVKMNDQLQNEIMGAIAVSKVNVKDADVTLNKKEAFKNETHKYVIKSSDRKFVIFEGELQNNQIDTVVINSFTISGTSEKELSKGDYIDLQLEINGKTITKDAQSRKITGNGTGITFEGFSQELKSEQVVPVKVTAMVYAYEDSSVNTTGFKFAYNASGYNKDVSARTPVGTTFKNVSTITILGKGEATTNTNVNSLKSSNVFSRGDTSDIAKWNVSVKNDTLTLTGIEISWTNLTGKYLENIQISYVNNDTKETGKLKKEGETSGDNIIKFIDESISLEPASYTFSLKVNFNDNMGTTDIVTDEVKMYFENADTTTGKIAYTWTVYPMVPTVSVKKVNDGAIEEAMEIEVYNPGKEDLVVTGIVFTGKDIKVKYNSTEVSDTNKVTINKNSSAIFKVTAADSDGFTGNVIIHLEKMNLQYDGISYEITDEKSENFKDIKASYRVSTKD